MHNTRFKRDKMPHIKKYVFEFHNNSFYWDTLMYTNNESKKIVRLHLKSCTCLFI